MKPKTKIEIAVNKLAFYLPELTRSQEEYAKSKFFEKQCFATKNTAFCLECGNDIDVATIYRKRVVCGCCGEKLEVIETRKRKWSSETYDFAIASLINEDQYDFQLVRNFEFIKHCRKGQKAKFYISEICQNWYEIKGKRVINAKLINGYNGAYYGILEIRKEGYWKTYDPVPDIYCPTSEFRAKYLKIGVSEKMEGISLDWILKKLYNPKIETLMKSGYYNVLGWESYQLDKYWDSLKICIRNKYKIKDSRSYLDMLKALDYLNKDLRNPVFVCPKNFKKSHNHWIDLKHQKEVGKEKAKNELEAKRWETKYFEANKQFLDLEFVDNGIRIKPLQSVAEFVEEGATLKHCVFKSGYYKEKDKLVFSAQLKGNRIETIEFDLNDFKVVQCRGFKNGKSEHHSKILQLMNKSIPTIKKVLQPA